MEDIKKKEELLSAAKAKMVSELLSADELNEVAGGLMAEEWTGPHWREFTKFVMSA